MEREAVKKCKTPIHRDRRRDKVATKTDRLNQIAVPFVMGLFLGDESNRKEVALSGDEMVT